MSLVGEVLWARYDPDDAAAQTVDVRGGHVTAIGRLTPWAQLLLRWDRLEDGRADTPRDLVIPSVAVVVLRVAPVQFQLDARIPLGAPDRTELIGNATVAF